MPYAGVNGQRLYYEIGGTGETAILLHGTFADADIMEAPATGMASGFRAIRIDRRGCGRSTPVEGPVSLADEATDVAALLDWFGTETAHFLTHDDGSEVAIELALRYPGRVLSLGLMAPTVDGFPWSQEAEAERAELLAAMRTDPRKAIEEKWLASPAFAVVKEHEGMLDRVAAIYRRLQGSAYRFDREREGPSQAERLSQITARCAVLVGDRDEPERLRCAETIADGIPGAELVTFPGLSRFLHVEESRPVMRRLTDFYIPEEEAFER